MSKWYIDDNGMILLDNVTCVQKCEGYVRVRHGLSEHWDSIYAKGANKQQKAESLKKIYQTIQEILTKPLDNDTKE